MTEQWIQHLSIESDTGCAIILSAILEERLCDLIDTRILTRVEDLLSFVDYLRNGGANPFGNFACAIDCASALKLIDKETTTALRRIKAIRNDLAHYSHPRRSTIKRKQVLEISRDLSADRRTHIAALLPISRRVVREAGYSPQRRLFQAICFSIIMGLNQSSEIYRLGRPFWETTQRQ